MEKYEGQEGSDLFQEIQDKVDREIFRETDADTTSAPDSSMGEASMTLPDADEFEVVVDVIDPDAMETEVEDAFLEEVDYLPPEGEPLEVDSLTSPPAGEPAETESLRREGAPVEPEEAFVQEDELFLGELIGREMGGPTGDEGTGDRSNTPEVAVSSSTEEAGGEKGDEEVLNTRTLAGLYADQGHYAQAIEIYDRLVRDHPEDMEIRTELEGLREKERTAGATLPAEAAGIEEWEELSGESGTETTRRLENWLARIQAEKERRCLRNS
ncbi:MAG: tetratricopeptide repeat protein [Deltaproteobacteria bacterium]|nr:tetratricopeptide repeat protein [Deltaproteobacteria bacterium]